MIVKYYRKFRLLKIGRLEVSTKLRWRGFKKYSFGKLRNWDFGFITFQIWE